MDQNGTSIVFPDMEIVAVPLIWPTDFSVAGGQNNQQRTQAITTLVNFLITVEEAKLTALENSSAGFTAPLFTAEPGQEELDELYAYYAAISEQETDVMNALDDILVLTSGDTGQPALAKPVLDWKETLFGVFGYAGNSGARARDRILKITNGLSPQDKTDAFNEVREGFKEDANSYDELMDRLRSGELDTQANQIESDMRNSPGFGAGAQEAGATVGQVYHQEGGQLVVKGGDLEVLVIKLTTSAAFPGITKGWDAAEKITKWLNYGQTFYNKGLISGGKTIAIDTLKDKIKERIKSDLGGSSSELDEIILDQIAGQISNDIVDNVTKGGGAGSNQPPAGDLQPAATEETAEKFLPRISATGQFTEVLSGNIVTNPPLGTTFELLADFSTGTVSGKLAGGRTVKNFEIGCYLNNNPSVAADTATANYTAAVQTSFSGALDAESGEFSAGIKPSGPCTARWTSPYTNEACLPLNNEPVPGCKPWSGEGTITGYVSKYGWVEFTTQWTINGGAVQVKGSWSGDGSIAAP